MNNRDRIIWITRTAAFIALLIILQAVTAPLGNIIITGSAVNLLLILSVMICGPVSGISVAALSPVMAKLFGIGPLWGIIPFIAAGNITLVLLWNFFGGRKTGCGYITRAAAVISAAVAKFLVLYIGIVKIALPLFLALPERQAAAVSNMFSIPQLATALIGGSLAAILLPAVKKAVGGKGG